MEKKKVRSFTKWIAMVAVFAMVIGMTLVVCATSEILIEYYNCSGDLSGDIGPGEKISLKNGMDGFSVQVTVVDKNGNALESAPLSSYGNTFNFAYDNVTGTVPSKIHYEVEGNGENGVTVTLTNYPSSGEASATSTSSEPVAAPHTHSFEWTVDYAATMNYPGKMSYRCTTCGKSLQEKVLPIENYYVESLYLLIRNTGEGNTVTYDAKDYHCIFDSQIKALAERPDVSVKINFTYEGKNYTMTIPCGRGYTDLLSDDENCYGYFNFANLVGGIIAER